MTGRIRRFRIASAAGWALLLACSSALGDGKPVDASTYRVFLEFYRYDPGLPLNDEITHRAEVEEDEHQPAHTRVSFAFTNNRDERVPGILWLPQGSEGPFPCVVYLHGLGGTKLMARPIANDLLRKGYAVMALDAAYHGEREAGKLPMYGNHFYRLRDSYIQTVVDYRRALDYLASRKDIDGSKITLIGTSMGAIMGAILAGVDERIRCPVLLVGGADRGMMARLSQIQVWKSIRAENPKLDFDDVSRILAPADPLNFVDKISPRPVLMINGTKDNIIVDQAGKLLHATAKDPKKVVWLESGHSLPLAETMEQILSWLQEHL